MDSSVSSTGSFTGSDNYYYYGAKKHDPGPPNRSMIMNAHFGSDGSLMSHIWVKYSMYRSVYILHPPIPTYPAALRV